MKEHVRPPLLALCPLALVALWGLSACQARSGFDGTQDGSVTVDQDVGPVVDQGSADLRVEASAMEQGADGVAVDLGADGDGGAGGVFPQAWQRRCALTIQASGVAGDLVHFPVLVTGASLPPELYAQASSGGGDLRFTADAQGQQKLAAELAHYDAAQQKAEIHVRIPAVSASSDTTFYVWYGASGKSQPAADTAADSDGFPGRHAVWKGCHADGMDYGAVYHLVGNTSGQITDSTVNANHVVGAGGSPNYRQPGPWGAANAIGFDGQSRLFTADATTLEGNPFTHDVSVAAWVKRTAPESGSPYPLVKGNPASSLEDRWTWAICGCPDFNVATTPGMGPMISGLGTLPVGSWRYLVGVMDYPELRTYSEGGETGRGTFSQTFDNSNDTFGLGFAGSAADDQHNDAVDLAEIRIYLGVLSAEEVITSYNNQSFPTAFVHPGSPVSP